MRIAVVASLLPPDAEGGTERVAATQARGLRALGHDVLLLGGRPAGAAETLRLEQPRLATVLLGSDPDEAPDPLGQRPGLLQRLLDELRAFRPDRVVIQNWWNLDPNLTVRCAAIAPTALALHDFHGLCPRSFRTPQDEGIACPNGAQFRARELDACARCVAPLAGSLKASRIRSLLEQRLELFERQLAAASLVLVPSRTHLVRMGDLVPLEGKARILEPGLCQEFPGLAPSPPPFDGKDALRILHHGRRSEAKGTLDLVRALAELPAGTVELVAMGGAEDGLDDRLRAAAPELPMELGGVYGATALEEAAARCHLAALPSRLPESYSLAVDEALALGLPVWACSADAARARHGADVVRELPAREPMAWAHALLEVLDQPARLEAQRATVPQDVPLAGAQAARLAQLLELADPRTGLRAS